MKVAAIALAAAATATVVSAYSIHYDGILEGDMMFLLGDCVNGTKKINYAGNEAALGSRCWKPTSGNVDLYCIIKEEASKAACEALKKRCCASYGGKWVPNPNGLMCPL
ncbi:hypothetical protein GQ42DRAFT_162121 [Ramicandelaber brevisporus]|nr:hypothetical protein GQ42DRAFT_162121 [Ramicandelaber brevisporus]